MYFVGWIGWMRLKNVHPLRFDFAVTLVWAASIALNLVPPLVGRAAFSFATIALIITSHAGLMMGFRLGRGRHPTFDFTGLTVARRGGAIRLLAWVTAGMVALTVVANLRRGTFPVLGSFGKVDLARTAYLAAGTDSLDPLSRLVQALKYPTLAFVALTPWLLRVGRGRLVLLAGGGLLALADASFQVGGRADLVFAVISVAGAFLFVYRVRTRTLLIAAAIGAILFFVLGSTFALTRNTNFSADQAFFIARVCPLQERGPWVSGDGSPETAALAGTLCYFVAPTHNLDDFISTYDDWDYTWGGYNAGLVTRGSFSETRAQIAENYVRRGLAPNPWATGVRDFWLDFGYLAPVAFVPLGYGVARLSRRCQVNDPMSLMRAALLLPWAFTLPFQSPVILPSLVYPLVLVELLHTAARLRWLQQPVMLKTVGAHGAGARIAQ